MSLCRRFVIRLPQADTIFLNIQYFISNILSLSDLENLRDGRRFSVANR